MAASDQIFKSMEVLLHNVSHSDLVLDVKLTCGRSNVARPKFHRFREVTKAIYDELKTQESANIRISSHLKHTRNKLSQEPLQYEVTSLSEKEYLPVGFDLSNNPVKIADYNYLRFRKDEILSNNGSDDRTLLAFTCYLPLLAILIPRWLAAVQHKLRPDCKLVLVFITGRGTPNEPSGRIQDNSTLYTGRIMTKFIELLYPFITVKHVHSSTNLFRYDENIVFVKKELLPTIDAMRDELIDMHTKLSYDAGKWKEEYKITLSFADGSSARVAAINASLKRYRSSSFTFV